MRSMLRTIGCTVAAVLAVACALTRPAPAAAMPGVTADLTFDVHLYTFRDTATPFFGPGISIAVRDEVQISGDGSATAASPFVFTEAGLVAGIATNALRGPFEDVLVPLSASISVGLDGARRFRGWLAVRLGVAANAASGWGWDFPWSVGFAGGVATRIVGPLMATIELSSMDVYPGGIASRIVTTRAGVRYVAEARP